MIRKAASARLMTSSLGMLIQIITLLFVVKMLDIYQFGLWGVANSLIYIFSIFGQIAFSQFIEKYFSGFNLNQRELYIFKIIKTVFFSLPIWILMLFILENFNYFEKFNSNNLYILFSIVAITSLVESYLNIFHSYFLIENKTIIYDRNDLMFGKVFKFIIFYFILSNNLSIYYLLLGNMFSRLLFLLTLAKHKKFFSLNIALKIIKADVVKNNFLNFKYNIVAFLDKTFYVSFINLLFLYSVSFVENITISHFSIAILVINNLRPVVDSISSLMPPIISKNIAIKSSNSDIKNKTLTINSFIFSILIFSSLLFTKYELIINFFLENYEAGVYKIIFVSVVCSGIHALYYPNYLENLYSGNENKLLLFTLVNQFFCIVLYSFLKNNFINNFLYIFIIYELLNLTFHFYFENKNESFKSILNNTFKPLCSSFIVSILFISIYFYNFDSNSSFFILLIPIIFDAFLISKQMYFNQSSNSNEKNEENK